ncbi:MAG: hypothetical protein ABIQ95_13580 [Bdellovibrionia bacterium]
MQKKYGIVILVIVLILTGIGLYWFFHSQNNSQTLTEKTTVNAVVPKPKVDPCLDPKYETERLEMKDGYMKGLIEAGEKYTVVKGWYRCNPVKPGDIVFYRYNTNFPPVPRLVQGVPGDKFKLIIDKKRKAWNLSVNGKVITNNDGQEPHYFGNESTAPVLSLYEKSMKGVLAPTTYLIFSTVTPGNFDSEMGVVNSEDFMGKVETLKKSVESVKVEPPAVKTSGKIDASKKSEALDEVDTQPE